MRGIQVPVETDQVDAALGEKPGVMGEVLEALVVLDVRRDSPETDGVAIAADEALASGGSRMNPVWPATAR